MAGSGVQKMSRSWDEHMGAAVRCAQSLDRRALAALDEGDVEQAQAARALAREGYEIATTFERWPFDTSPDTARRAAEVTALRAWEERASMLLGRSSS